MAQSVDSSKGVATRPFSPLKAFLKAETSSAAVLALGAAAALIWANSPLESSYVALWSHDVGFSVGDWTFVLDIRHWINDGLMTIFFLVVGLEIKRELTQGHLSNLRAALLPCIAAMGGMLTPAVIYLAIAGSVEPRGWAIPVATDIALAVGALSVVGRRVPTSGRVFLLALAIVDDIGAIAIIAIAYSKGLSPNWLVLALAAVITTVVLQRTSVQSVAPYALVGACMWFGLYQAGVHPTIAGVVMGLMTPSVPRRQIRVAEENGDIGAIYESMNSTDGKSAGEASVIDWLQHALHPWTSLLIVPIFALANSGVEITSDGLRGAVQSPITWGIFFGLFIGKPLGITLTTWLAVRSRAADMPAGASKKQVVGIGSAAGIGFTVAMFITELALQGETDVANAKLAILAASVLSAVISITLLKAGRK